MLALILANGEPPPREMLALWRRRADWFVCCDGAVTAALALGETPETVLGDLDSAPAELPAGIDLLRIEEQETTDLEKALYTALARGYNRVVVLGAGGRRWDLFQLNLMLFARYCDRLAIEAGDAYGWLRLLPPGTHRLELPPGSKFSLLPLPRAEGFRCSGVRWPLTDVTLAVDGHDDISNEAGEGPVVVQYTAGCLALYQVAPTA